jgi:hypothetical protein
MSDERPTPAAAARVPADLTGRDPSRTLAGLIDVLDRADGSAARRRPHPHPRHAAAARAAAYRSGAARTVPLRSVRPAPPARPAPAPFRPAPARPVAPAAPAATQGLLSRLTRRVAFWGAGPDGAYLAWGAPAASASVPAASAPVAPPRAPVAPGPGFFGALVRKVAFWGAGEHGEYLAWSAVPPPRAAARISLRPVDAPVVLRELPSTPTVQPAVPSPAAALVPGPAPSPAEPVAPPAPIGHRPPAPPVVASESAGPRVPVQSARTPQPTGWPQRPPRSSHRPARSFPTATGLARARGDPAFRARGSPRPPPCRAPRAPG